MTTIVVPPAGPPTAAPSISPGRVALLAGIALAVMAVVGGFAGFAVAPADGRGVSPGNLGLVRAAIVAFLVTAALDVVVAVSLRRLFMPVNPLLASLAATLRLVYAATLLAATGFLLLAVDQVADPVASRTAVATFDGMWQIGLAVFGLHLTLLGALAVRAEFVHWLFGVLLVVAGAGYAFDTLALVLTGNPGIAVGQFTFVGEVTFMAWLLIRGTRLRNDTMWAVQR